MRFGLPKPRWLLRRRAAVWLAKLEGDDPERVRPAFERWYRADARHAEAFDRMRGHYAQIGLMRNSRLPRPGLAESRSPEIGRRPRYALAGAVAAALLIPGGLLLADQMFAPTAAQAVVLSTGVGEIRVVKLVDGSKVTLDTQSRLAVELAGDRRSAVLERGRARVAVARDARPFVVKAGVARISTREAVFDARTDGANGTVELLAGSARVSAQGGPVQEAASPLALQAGSGMSATAGHQPQIYPVLAQRSDWTRGMLQFDATPLSEAIAEANRYSARKIAITDPEIAALRVTGAFKAGDTLGLARSLAAVFGLKVDLSASAAIVLSRSPESPAQKKKGG